MNFEEWWEENEPRMWVKTHPEIAKEAWQAAQQAERERIRLRTALAANTVWQIGKESTCPVYTGPQEHLLDEFVDALIKNELDT